MDNEKLKKVLSQKPSAYRSMHIAKLRNYSGNNKKKNENDLQKWILERWVNLNAQLKGYTLPCGKKYPGQTTPTVCRPSIKIDNKKTPTPLASELTNKQIKKAIKIKQSGKRINWKDLK
jgi:hypothetical protein